MRKQFMLVVHKYIVKIDKIVPYSLIQNCPYIFHNPLCNFNYRMILMNNLISVIKVDSSISNSLVGVNFVL